MIFLGGFKFNSLDEICFFFSLDQLNQPSCSLVIDKDSEVYKMLQENQDSNEPPRQSTSFLVLQEILESEEKGKRPDREGQTDTHTRKHKVTKAYGLNRTFFELADPCVSFSALSVLSWIQAGLK